VGGGKRSRQRPKGGVCGTVRREEKKLNSQSEVDFQEEKITCGKAGDGMPPGFRKRDP